MLTPLSWLRNGIPRHKLLLPHPPEGDKRQRLWAEIREIYWKQKWDKKKNSNSKNNITKVYKERLIYIQNCSPSWGQWKMVDRPYMINCKPWSFFMEVGESFSPAHDIGCCQITPYLGCAQSAPGSTPSCPLTLSLVDMKTSIQPMWLSGKSIPKRIHYERVQTLQFDFWSRYS